MVPTSRLSEEQLRAMADDAFEVLNWARRHGMKRDQQVVEVTKAFEVRLGYRPHPTESAPKGCHGRSVVIAAGVAIGFVGWIIGLIAGFSVARDDSSGVTVFLLIVSLALWVISYAMVTP